MPARRPGRPPEGGPPTRFTRSDVFTDETVWVVSTDQEPGEVAAAYAQQQLMAALRRVDRNISAADVAKALGRSRTDRTVHDVWSGRRAIALRMLLSIALSYDIKPLGHYDENDQRSLLPEAHRSWLGTWEPGRGRPVFRSPLGPDGEPAWDMAVRFLSEWIDQENLTGSLRLVNDQVATHAAISALAKAGLPIDLVADRPVPSAPRHLHYETAPPVELAVVFIPDSPLVTQERLIEAIGNMHRLAQSASGRAAAILLSAPRTFRRLEALMPGCCDAQKGDSVLVPASTLNQIAPISPGAPVPELTLTTLAIEHAENEYVTLIYDLPKVGN